MGLPAVPAGSPSSLYFCPSDTRYAKQLCDALGSFTLVINRAASSYVAQYKACAMNLLFLTTVVSEKGTVDCGIVYASCSLSPLAPVSSDDVDPLDEDDERFAIAYNAVGVRATAVLKLTARHNIDPSRHTSNARPLRPIGSVTSDRVDEPIISIMPIINADLVSLLGGET
jgi:hypothetical protein